MISVCCIYLISHWPFWINYNIIIYYSIQKNELFIFREKRATKWRRTLTQKVRKGNKYGKDRENKVHRTLRKPGNLHMNDTNTQTHTHRELIPAELTTQLHKMLRYQVCAIHKRICDESRKKSNNMWIANKSNAEEKNRFELQCGNANIRQDKQPSEVQCVHTSNDFNTVFERNVERKKSWTFWVIHTHMHKTIVNCCQYEKKKNCSRFKTPWLQVHIHWRTVSKSILGARAKNCSTLLSLLIA